MKGGRGTMIGAVFAGASSLIKWLPRKGLSPVRDDRDDVFKKVQGEVIRGEIAPAGIRGAAIGKTSSLIVPTVPGIERERSARQW